MPQQTIGCHKSVIDGYGNAQEMHANAPMANHFPEPMLPPEPEAIGSIGHRPSAIGHFLKNKRLVNVLYHKKDTFCSQFITAKKSEVFQGSINTDHQSGQSLRQVREVLPLRPNSEDPAYELRGCWGVPIKTP
ncbi:MAG: hypothetical protein WJ306_03510 [Ferrovum myxofaciens]